jgi:hypothetical protein
MWPRLCRKRPFYSVILQNTPRTLKKIGITLLVWVFKGLIGLKKVLTLLLLVVKHPFFWLYKAFLLPVIIVVYKLYRWVKKWV